MTLSEFEKQPSQMQVVYKLICTDDRALSDSYIRDSKLYTVASCGSAIYQTNCNHANVVNFSPLNTTSIDRPCIGK